MGALPSLPGPATKTPAPSRVHDVVSHQDSSAAARCVYSHDVPLAESVETLDKAKLEAMVGGERDKDTMVVLYAPWCQFCQGLEPTYNAVADTISGEKLRVAKYQADTDKEYAQSIGLTTFPTILFMPKNTDKIVKFTSDRRTEESLEMWANALGER